MNTVSPTSNIGTADNHRRTRLLDLVELLARSDGGQARLKWPGQTDVLAATGRRDLSAFGDESPGMLTLGQQIRKHSAIARAGATFITLPLTGEVGLPEIDRSMKASWNTTAADVAPTLALTTSMPKRVSAYVLASKSLLKMSPILAAGFLEAQLLSAIGGALDDAAINGSGTDEPFGLLTDSQLLEEEFTTSITVANLLAMEKAVASNHGEADAAVMTWLADPATREALRGLPRMTGGTTPAWPDGLNQGPLAYRGIASPFAPANTLIFGNFTDLLVLQSDSIEVLQNPYSLDMDGFIRLTITAFFDVVVLSPDSSFVRAIAAE